VARRGGAVATDTSEAYGVSVVARLGELCEATSTGGELVVVAFPVGVSAVARLGELCEATSTAGEFVVVVPPAGVSLVVRLGELCEAVSTGSELVVVAPPAGVSMVAILGEFCEAVSTGSELVVVAPAVVGVGDVATDRFFGSYVRTRITKTSTTPVKSTIVPKKNCFGREACVGNGGVPMVDRGGAPHEGQAVANELISLPQS